MSPESAEIDAAALRRQFGWMSVCLGVLVSWWIGEEGIVEWMGYYGCSAHSVAQIMMAMMRMRIMMICQQPRWRVIQYGPLDGLGDGVRSAECQSVKRRVSGKCIVYNFNGDKRTADPGTKNEIKVCATRYQNQRGYSALLLYKIIRNKVVI